MLFVTQEQFAQLLKVMPHSLRSRLTVSPLDGGQDKFVFPNLALPRLAIFEDLLVDHRPQRMAGGIHQIANHAREDLIPRRLRQGLMKAQAQAVELLHPVLIVDDAPHLLRDLVGSSIRLLVNATLLPLLSDEHGHVALDHRSSLEQVKR